MLVTQTTIGCRYLSYFLPWCCDFFFMSHTVTHRKLVLCRSLKGNNHVSRFQEVYAIIWGQGSKLREFIEPCGIAMCMSGYFMLASENEKWQIQLNINIQWLVQ